MQAGVVAGFLGLAGLVLSLYLTIAPTPEFCDITSYISCDRVLTSPYAQVFGVPTAMFGAVWFAAASVTAFLATERRGLLAVLKPWSVLGLIGVVALTYVELFLINAVCLLCTAAHVLAVSIFITVFIAMK